MAKKRHFTENFYVRFYYRQGSEEARMAGHGPHYAPCDTREEGETHADLTLRYDEDVINIEILSREELNS